MASHIALQGDCLDTLKLLPDQSMHMCVTSPPYFGLRDYGNDSQLGLEESPAAYIANMVKVFQEVKRVLRDDGTLWLNLGDSYAGSGRGVWNIPDEEKKKKGTKETYRPSKNPIVGRHTDVKVERGKGMDRSFGYKPKDLMGIPWRVAFALQDDGWYLRQDIIWHKPNPMPESVKDRCTKAHEYIFLFSKQPSYFFDHEAMKEPASKGAAGSKFNKGKTADHLLGRSSEKERDDSAMRNRRSVWSVTTKPFKGAHFATFPPDLIQPCVAAGSSDGGCCAKCGSPYKRIVEVGEVNLDHQRACGGDANGSYNGISTKDYTSAKAQDASETKRRILESMRQKVTVGFEPICECNAPNVPCRVLDPFGGSGTTSLVSDNRGRDSIICELNPEYIAIAQGRVPSLRAVKPKVSDAV